MPIIHPSSLTIPKTTTGGVEGSDKAGAKPKGTGIAGLKADKIGMGAVRRIFSSEADPTENMIGRGQGKRIRVGQIGRDKDRLDISASGRFLIDGKLAGKAPGQGGDAKAIYRAAQIAAEQKGLFDKLPMSSAMRGRVLGQLSKAIDYAQSGARSTRKEKAFCGAMTLLIDLARTAPKSDTTVRRAVVDRLLQALSRESDVEQVGFYLQSMRDLFKKLDKVQTRALKTIIKAILPQRPPVEAWTNNRTKPLEVRHMIHHEFYKDELKFFSKKNGFKLIKKNKKDDFRIYEGELKDPAGKKKPLKVRIEVRKGEIDFLDDMGDPNTHVLMYSGHSALGGNGSEAVQSGPEMAGEHTKLVLVANCRGKDNYAEFTNKYPDSHVIMTEEPTYGPAGEDRVRGLFDMLARGATYRHMRAETEYAWWDEPADNYFYPDEWRKFRFMDSDSDGKMDLSGLGSDRLFDVDARNAGGKFVRAVNFANSELFYHWEVDHENGEKSFFGKKYGDSLVPDGVIKDAKKDEIVRVSPVKKKGGKATRFRVRFNPAHAKHGDDNLYLAQVTLHTVMALAKHKTGKLSKHEVLRAALMGAQGIHYMDVYEDSSPVVTKNFFKKIGLHDNIKASDVDKIFDKYDAHGNDAQVAAFEKLLTEKYGVDTNAWYESFKAKHPSAF